MMLSEYFNPKKTLNLFGYNKKFTFLKNLLISDRFPHVLMLTGEKGIGKSTLINHLLHYYYDKENYNDENNIIDSKSVFHNQFINNLFPNIIYLSDNNFVNMKIDEIRKLKQDLLKTPIIQKKRFIILDDVESLNINSLNALLKIIEEPNKFNFFILINNKTKSILETLKSRSIEITVILRQKEKEDIILSLIDLYDQKLKIDKNFFDISPGNFLKFNSFLNDKKIDISEKFSSNLKKILELYKKEKNIIYKDLLIFLVNYYSRKSNLTSSKDKDKIIAGRNYVIKQVNNFFVYNMNQNSLINALERNLIND